MPSEWQKNLQKMLETIKRNTKIQTVGMDYLTEEVLPPDIERQEDDKRSVRKGKGEVFECFEADGITRDGKFNAKGSKKSVVRKIEAKRLFWYFIDGTLRTYYLGEVIAPHVFPVVFSEVAAACLERDNDGLLHKKYFENKSLLILPFTLCSDTLLEELKKLSPSSIELVNSDDDKIKQEVVEGLQTDLRQRAGGIARYKMHELEIDLMRRLLDEFEQKNSKHMAIIDGSISNSVFASTAGDKIIALTKSPSFKPRLKFGEEELPLAYVLSMLEYEERTVVFRKRDPDILLWYLRIYKKENLIDPFEGIVKIEMAYPKELKDVELLKENSTNPHVHQILDKVNQISSAILYETTINLYPCPRWSSNIYPIAKTEDFMKANLKSSLYVRGSIRW